MKMRQRKLWNMTFKSSNLLFKIIEIRSIFVQNQTLKEQNSVTFRFVSNTLKQNCFKKLKTLQAICNTVICCVFLCNLSKKQEKNREALKICQKQSVLALSHLLKDIFLKSSAQRQSLGPSQPISRRIQDSFNLCFQTSTLTAERVFVTSQKNSTSAR